MASKRNLSTSSSPEQTAPDTPVTQPENSSKSYLCLICGDTARINNYGALSCQSCKTFFRRNGFRPQSVRPCTSNNCCQVNMQTRHNCTSCRLAKCFTMGMTSDLIRKEDHKKVKNPSLEKSDTTEDVTLSLTQITTVSKTSTLDLVNSEWTLISNILHAYDTYSTVLKVCQTIDTLSTLPAELHLNVINPLEIVSQMFTSIQSFISSFPDFQILTINEKTSLFERNLHGIIGFYSTLFFRNTGILHNIKCMEAFTTIYGSEMMLLAKKVNDLLDPDSTLIKLILIIFAFSSNCFIVNKQDTMERDSLLYGTFRLLGSQNVYLELLWKYMIYRYGYNQAILRFSRLVQRFLCVLKHLASIHENNEVHHNMVDGIIGKTIKSLTTNENEQTSLWGKT